MLLDALVLPEDRRADEVENARSAIDDGPRFVDSARPGGQQLQVALG